MNINQHIRIAIADDHPMILDGLQNMVRNYPQLVLTGSYPDGNSLLKGIEEDTPDILLLDIQMPDYTGDHLAPALLKKHPALSIIVLTNLDSTLALYNMVRLGARGYLLKTTDQKTLIQAIEAVYQGGEFIEVQLKDRLEQFTRRMKKESAMKPSLTLREKQILQLIINGYTGQEIADKLCLGFRTVEHYRENIMHKLEVRNTALLVKKTLTLGLVE
jgi:DNA-binding NarL/FixJ family response regulator